MFSAEPLICIFICSPGW